MTETTLTTSLTPEQLAEAVRYMNARAEAERLEREAAKARRDAAFTELLPDLSPVLERVVLTHDMETWHRTDPKTKKKTDQVSGIGYHAMGRASVRFDDGTVRECSVNVWIKANPKNGVPPEVSED